MANKVRCKNCKEYFDRSDGRQVGLGWVHAECGKEYFQTVRSRPKPKSKKSLSRVKYDSPQRELILTRDQFSCRLCGGEYGLAVHHINYRSEYDNKWWENEVWNLITLCNRPCHLDIVHEDKATYKPILLGMNWLYYTTGRLLSVPQFQKEFIDNEFV